MSQPSLYARFMALFTLEERTALAVSQLTDQIASLQSSVTAFEAEVQTDIANLLTQIQSLQTQVTELQANSADPASLQNLADLTKSLTDATTALHTKVTPQPASSSSSSSSTP